MLLHLHAQTHLLLKINITGTLLIKNLILLESNVLPWQVCLVTHENEILFESSIYAETLPEIEYSPIDKYLNPLLILVSV